MPVEARGKGDRVHPLTALDIPGERVAGSDMANVSNQERVGQEGTTMNGEQKQNTQPQQAHNGNENIASSQANSHSSAQNTKNGSATAQSSTTAQKQHPAPVTAVSRHPEPTSPIDPLSQHILTRTNTEKSLSKPRSQPLTDSGPSGSSEARRSLAHEDNSAPARGDAATPQQQRAPKEKKKGVSFLSRFIGNKKRDPASESNDDASELGENRAAGTDAEVFAQPIGFMPRFPPPPKYIKVRSHHKKQSDFNRMFVAQELRGRTEPDKPSPDKSSPTSPTEPDDPEPTGKAVWVLKFSKDGRYLAAAGQDRIVRVWAVIATPEDRQAHEIEEEARNDQPLIRLRAPVFKSQPVQEFEGHTASVVDLSWSKNKFLLSTSMDKTVRLWHVTRDECLCIFNHSDFVTSIEFHPRDDRFFLAGSLDSKLRLWSIPDKSVAFRANVPDMITAVAFTPDGKHSIAGCLNGLCLVYDTEGLKVQSQIHVRSARGKNAKGSKITGIDTIVNPPGSENGIIKLLITSNDSRIRLYNFRDRTLEAKFRGNDNATSQIRASFSSDGRYLICGSEDRRAYIWPLGSALRDADKRPVEVFEAHSSIVTSAAFAPVQTKQVLGSTGDLLYDLCNPPPITLGGQAHSMTSKQPTEDESRPNGDSVSPSKPGAPSMVGQGRESPAYLARSNHPGGNIIVTADYNGCIKVFRQDCGYHKRRPETWDGNTSLSKKLLGRTRSISTRRSRASSLGKESHHKTPSERILSWRSGVIDNNENPSTDSIRNSAALRTRSSSPNTSILGSTVSQKQEAQRAATPSDDSPDRTPPLHSPKPPARPNPFSSAIRPKRVEAENSQVTTPLANQEKHDDPLWLEGDKSYMFWNPAKYTAQANRPRRPSAVDAGPPGRSGSRHSMHSAMSSDPSEAGPEEQEGEEDGEELKCRHCKGSNFRATRTRQGDQRLICVQCGSAAS